MRGRQSFVAGMGVILALTTSATRAGAAGPPPSVMVLAAPRITAAPLTQVAGFGAVWVLSDTEWIGNPSDYTEIRRSTSGRTGS